MRYRFKIIKFICIFFILTTFSCEKSNNKASSEKLDEKELKKIRTHVVKIFLKNKTSLNPNGEHCTGWMISPKIIITAAHCFKNDLPPYNQIIEVSRLQFGSPETETRLGSDIESIITHNDWPNINTYADISIIKMRANKEFNNVEIIPILKMPYKFKEGEKVIAFGFSSNTIVKSTILKPTAQELMNLGINKEQSKQTICIGDSLKPGDSGGPLYYILNEKIYVIGSLASLNGCAANLAKTTFTSLERFNDWIEKNLK